MARPAHDYARVDKHVPVTRQSRDDQPVLASDDLDRLVATLGILLYAQFLLNPSEPRRLSAVRAGDRGRDDPDHARAAGDVDHLVRLPRARVTSPSTSRRTLMFDKKAIKAAGLKEQPHSWPIMLRGKEITVDVFITVYGEELDKIQRHR